MYQTLHGESTLQTRYQLGISVCLAAIGTATPTNGTIMSLIMIDVHLSFGANRGVRMFRLDPFYAFSALGTLELEHHL